MRVESGRDTTVVLVKDSPGATVLAGPQVTDGLLAAVFAKIRTELGSAAVGSGPDRRALSVIETALNAQVDVYRDRLKAGFPREAADRLKEMLGNLPGEASPYIVYRIKANIGHSLLQLQEVDDALLWLDEAVASGADEPKAVATRAFAMVLRKEYVQAVEFAKQELAADPDNEDLAAHLIEACMSLDGVNDPLALIPPALKERERVMVATCLYHRQRDDQFAWWAVARAGARRYPDSQLLKLFSAESAVDEIARATRNEIYRPLTATERTSLATAAASLGATWTAMKHSEVPLRDDGVAALSTAMVAQRLLEEALAAVAMASDLIDHTDFKPALVLAVQVALAFDDDAVAAKGLAKLPDTGQGGFLKGMVAFNEGDWETAAAFYARCDVPEAERPFVECALRLAPFAKSDEPEDQDALDHERLNVRGEPRALMVISKLALKRGFPELSSRAYKDAVALIGPNMHLPARITIAGYASDIGDHGAVIRALDGIIDTGALTHELQWLADAHASEVPPRERNSRFFENLPSAIRSAPSIARGHASVLANSGRVAQAELILRRLVDQTPQDPFGFLMLIGVLRKSGRLDEAKEIVVSRDENAFTGHPSYRMQWAHELRAADQFQRALALGYHLVRTHPDRPQMSLGYVGLVFSDTSERIIPHQDVVDPDCWVLISDGAGGTDSFIIDRGSSFLGLDVVPPETNRARNVLGLRVGESFKVNGLLGRLQTWTVMEVKSKYLHVLHVVMDGFQKRFPTVDGLWKLTMPEGSVQPALEIVREHAQARKENAERLYIKGNMPLAIVASSTGSDVFSFAQFIRSLDANIITTGGTLDERASGIRAARGYRGRGAVLDTYTAVVATDLGMLDFLQRWFGNLVVAASTIGELDDLISQVASGRGRQSMTIGVIDGQLVAEEITDEVRERRGGTIKTLKGKIEAACEVVAVELPDDAPDEIADFARKLGPHVFDAMFLAASRRSLLVTDDAHYRNLAVSLAKAQSAWLQAVILAARDVGEITAGDQSRFVVGLAELRHAHVWLDLPSLRTLFEEASDKGFESGCQFIGMKTASMHVHCAVVAVFLDTVWRSKDQGLKREARTSILVDALLRHRRDDWPTWFACLCLYVDGNTALRQCLLTWLRGHFLPARPVVASVRHLAPRLHRGPAAQITSASSFAMTVRNEWFLPPPAASVHRITGHGDEPVLSTDRKHRAARCRQPKRRKNNGRYRPTT